MKKYKTVLFDLDGTLTDPGEGITNSIQYLLKKFGIEAEEKEKLYKFIGPPIIETLVNDYGFTSEDAQRGVEYYREYFIEKGMFENIVFDDTEKMLSELKEKGYTLIIATSKAEAFARQILEHFGLAKYFIYIAGSAMDSTRVKKGEVIAYALEKCNVSDLESTIMVGDRMHDVTGAKQCGIKVIGVLYGYGSRQELEEAGADYLAESIDDVLKILD